MHDCCRGLGQAQLIEQPAEPSLAMCGAIAVKTWQRQSGAMPQPFLHAREQKSLFVIGSSTSKCCEVSRSSTNLRNPAGRRAVPGNDEIFGQSAKTSRGTSDWDRRPQRGDLTARGS